MPTKDVSSIRYLVSGIKNKQSFSANKQSLRSSSFNEIRTAGLTKYKILNTKYCKSKGFTLIELLIVISIIGILATFVIASFTGAQARGRDARRKADLDAIKKAVELAKADSTGSTYYPYCETYSTVIGNLNACEPTGTITAPDLSPTYIKTVPSDPSGGIWDYAYIPSPASCGASVCTSFVLRVCLENTNDPQKETPFKVGCTGSGQNASYMVQSP